VHSTDQAVAVLGSFPFGTQVKKADRLSSALAEAKTSCDAAKAADEEKVRKEGAFKPDNKDEEDWEFVEGAGVDGDDYVDVSELLYSFPRRSS